VGGGGRDLSLCVSGRNQRGGKEGGEVKRFRAAGLLSTSAALGGRRGRKSSFSLDLQKKKIKKRERDSHLLLSISAQEEQRGGKEGGPKEGGRARPPPSSQEEEKGGKKLKKGEGRGEGASHSLCV